MSVRITQTELLVSSKAASKVRVTQVTLLISVPAPLVSITYPLTPPTGGLTAQTAKLRLVSVVGETASPFSGSQQEQQWPTQWWELEVKLPPMKRAANVTQRSDKRFTAEQWTTFLAALGGRFGTFLQGDPNVTSPAGIATGSPVTSGTSVPAPNNVISTTGWTASVTGILLAGDYIQVTPSGGVQRLYKVLFDTNSDSGGNANITVAPMLKETLTAGLSIITANPQGTFRLDENQAEWDIDQAKVYGISFKAKEAF